MTAATLASGNNVRAVSVARRQTTASACSAASRVDDELCLGRTNESDTRHLCCDAKVQTKFTKNNRKCERKFRFSAHARITNARVVGLYSLISRNARSQDQRDASPETILVAGLLLVSLVVTLFYFSLFITGSRSMLRVNSLTRSSHSMPTSYAVRRLKRHRAAEIAMRDVSRRLNE